MIAGSAGKHDSADWDLLRAVIALQRHRCLLAREQVARGAAQLRACLHRANQLYAPALSHHRQEARGYLPAARPNDI